jgi:hypothetical protein
MRVRLLLLVVALAGVSTTTWYLVRNKPPQTPPRIKTKAELLIGVWKIVEQEDPPLPQNLTALTEFTEDGKTVLRLTESRRGPLPTVAGRYQLKGDIIRFDSESSENPGGALQTWNAKIESITDDTLVLIGVEGKPRRLVAERERGN